MRAFLLLSTIIALFSGCSKNEYRVSASDKQKSCSAFLYEYRALKERVPYKYDENGSKSSYLHKGVVGAGIIASLNPAMIFSSYFYIFPAITIWYYNFFFEDSQKIKNEQRNEQRVKTIKKILENKKCKEGL